MAASDVLFLDDNVIKNVNYFQIAKFQPGVAYESVACKKSVYFIHNAVIQTFEFGSFKVFAYIFVCVRSCHHGCSPTQVFSCKYYEIFKNNYFEKHLRTAASDEHPFDKQQRAECQRILGNFQYSNWLTTQIPKSRSCCQEVFCKEVLLKILENSQENISVRVSFLIEFQSSSL